ncbi:hypothetical protein RRG08_029943 [Elysia crispata]|uniref:Uncharacterized protein n=1 Tax=Elysia crispata TaxID=231223 RepID=A0AAE0ZIW5_9GAST|nr:hypothetical protein RRG08_029943 [Elysia crispata]
MAALPRDPEVIVTAMACADAAAISLFLPLSPQPRMRLFPSSAVDVTTGTVLLRSIKKRKHPKPKIESSCICFVGPHASGCFPLPLLRVDGEGRELQRGKDMRAA